MRSADQRGRVVQQRLALQHGDDPARQPDPAGDGGGGDRVRRRHDAPKANAAASGIGSNQYATRPTRIGREDHQTDRQQAIDFTFALTSTSEVRMAAE